jgi:hypothetical protein
MFMEVACCAIRRYKMYLDALEYENDEDKKQKQDQFANFGLTRIAVHALCSDVAKAFNCMIRIHCELGLPLTHATINKHHRLTVSYQTFDAALRHAAARLPKSVVNSWMRTGVVQDCAICLTSVEATETCLQLPCAHVFHGGCATQWLHAHTSCPFCRRILSTTNP